MNVISKKIELKNHGAFYPIASRSYYPDHNKMLTHLMNLKADVKNGVLTDKNIIRSQMISAMQMAENLSLYYDYCDHPSITDGENVYGARVGKHPIGGGRGYEKVENPDFTATTDDHLHDFNMEIKPGQVMFIADECAIDLADFLIGGDTVGYNGVKVPFEFKVKDNNAWVGERGVGDCGGAILKVTSFTDCTIVLGENARLSGLVIQGPDMPVDIKNHDQNFSLGIYVRGNGAIIENCEISGFYRTGIHVYYSKDVKICNNYIHDILGPYSGRAIYLEGSSAEIYENLFSNVTSAVSMGFQSSLDFHDNMDAGNVRGPYITIFSHAPSISIHHNTFLSPIELLSTSVNVNRFSIENNIFAYPEVFYKQSYLAAVTADIFKNNVFDIQNPIVLSKSGDASASDNELLGKYSYVVSDKLTPHEIKKIDASPYSFTAKEILPALACCYYTETNDKGYIALRNLIRDDSYNLADFPALISKAIADIGGYTNYIKYEDEGLVSLEVDGQRYGAYSDGDMIGGGYGYSDIFTTGDYIVTNEAELHDAFSKAKPGEVVFMPGDAYINLSDAPTHFNRTVVIPAGITLASDRGRVKEDGTVSTGAIIATSAQIYHNVLITGGEGIRLTGFVFKGADPGRHVGHHTRTQIVMKDKTGISSYYYRVPNTYGLLCCYDNIEIDNMEVCGFNTVAIGLANSHKLVENAAVHHNFIHHNQIKGLGYGVRIDGAFVHVKYNMFNYNRHSIASGGMPSCSYIAENNIDMGESLDHYYDMHGGVDRHDGTNIAGGEVYIRNNSFLGLFRPFVQRGIPVTAQDFSFNVTYLDDKFCAKLVAYYGERIENCHVGKNIWNIQTGKYDLVDGVE